MSNNIYVKFGKNPFKSIRDWYLCGSGRMQSRKGRRKILRVDEC